MNNKDNFLNVFVPKIFQPLPSRSELNIQHIPSKPPDFFLKIMFFSELPQFCGITPKKIHDRDCQRMPRAFQKHLGFHRYFPLSNGLSVPAAPMSSGMEGNKKVVSAFCFSFPDGNPISENPKFEFMASWNLNILRNMIKNTPIVIIEPDGSVSDWIPRIWRGWKTHRIQKAARCLFFGAMLNFDTKKHQGILKHRLNKTSHVFHDKVGPGKPVVSRSYKPSNPCIRPSIRVITPFISRGPPFNFFLWFFMVTKKEST